MTWIMRICNCPFSIFKGNIIVKYMYPSDSNCECDLRGSWLFLPAKDLVSLHAPFVEPLLFYGFPQDEPLSVQLCYLCVTNWWVFGLFPAAKAAMQSDDLTQNVMLCFLYQPWSGKPPFACHSGTMQVPHWRTASIDTCFPSQNLAELHVFVFGDVTITSVEYDMCLVVLTNLMHLVALSRI